MSASGHEYQLGSGIDLHASQACNTRLQQITGTSDFETLVGGVIGFYSTNGDKHIGYYDDQLSSMVKVPRMDFAESLTGQWTFAPGSVRAPFLLGSNAAYQLVVGLNADTVDGWHASQSATANTVAVRNNDATLTIADANQNNQAVTLSQLTAAINNRDEKGSVRAATAGPLPSNTISGNVITASANGALPAQDGVSLIVGDRLLVIYEGGFNATYLGSTDRRNGIYVVTDLGSVSTPWVITRAADADANSEVTNGMVTFVGEGTQNLHSEWSLITADPINLTTNGTDGTAFQFSLTNANTLYLAGNGIVLSGNKFHFATSSNYTQGGIAWANSLTTMAVTGALSGILQGNGSSGPTGVTAAAAGSVLPYFTTTSTVSTTAQGASGTVLHGNAGSAPTWSAVSLTADISGILGMANGGTGADLTGAGANGGIVWKQSGTVLTITSALTGILKGNGASAPTAVTGTLNKIVKWGTSGQTLADSLLTDDGTNVTQASGQFLAPAGSASLPSFSFSGDTGTGIYAVASHTLGFAVNGILKWKIDSGGQLLGLGVPDATRMLYATSSSTDGSLLWENTFSGYAGTLQTLSVPNRANSSAFNFLTLSNQSGVAFNVRGDGFTRLGPGADFAVQMTTPAGVSAALASGGSLTVSTAYYYVVVTVGGAGGTTIQSAEVTATPTTGNQKITVSWSAVTGAASYTIYRSTTSGTYGATSLLVSGVTATTYTDDGSVSLTTGTPPTVTTAYVNKITASGNSWFVGGNVGFGKAAPLDLVHLSGGNVRVENANDGIGIKLVSTSTAGNKGALYHINQAGTERWRMVFDTAGNKTDDLQFISNNNGTVVLVMAQSGLVTPGADATQDFGASGTRWGVGYFNQVKASSTMAIGGALQSTVELVVTQPVRTNGSPTSILWTGGAHTTLAAAEAIDVNFNAARTVQFTGSATPGAANIATQRAFVFQAPTYAFSSTGAQTITDAATVAITGAPAAGTNATITNAWALMVQSGASKFGGKVAVIGGDIEIDSTHSFKARYSNVDYTYSGTLIWNTIQLGNNGLNYIVAGRTAAGGTLAIVVNNSSDSPTINGTTAMVFDTAGFVTPGSNATQDFGASGTRWRTGYFSNLNLSGDVFYTGKTDNYLPKWSSNTLTGTSLVYDNGTNVIIGGTTDLGTGKLQVYGSIQLTSVTAGARYVLLDSDATGTGTLILQAGKGSSGFGGGIIMYSHAHATKPGWVTAGISASSGGKFSVNTQGLGGGGDNFTVDTNGVIYSSALTGSQFVKTDSTQHLVSFDLFGTANTWTAAQTFNPGTTSSNVILLDMEALGSAGQRDSHMVEIRGAAYDTGAHTANWRYWVDVTSNAGASSMVFQSRIDSATWTTRLEITDAGVLKCAGFNVVFAYTTTLSTSAMTYTITHNLNATRLNAVLKNRTTGAIGTTGCVIVDANTATVYFDVAPASNLYDLTLLALP